MKVRKATAALAVLGILGIAIVIGDEIPSKAPEKLPAPVVDTHELMELFNEPLYKDLKKAMASQPKDEKGWSTIKHDGIRAAEIANLIAIRKSDDVAKWDPLARDAQQSALNLVQAATAQDWQKTLSAYTGLIKNCNDCHQTFGHGHAPELEP